nr:MAG TPA: KilAC domain protein [Caudoviricetes sp.]
MNELQIMNISGVSCYEKDGTAYLNLEAVARGLGFTQTKNGVEYVKWERVSAYLSELGFSPEVGKDGYIPENIFYRLAMKAKNETAEKFQALVADEIIPSIRKTGGYLGDTAGMSDMDILARAVLIGQRQIEQKNAQIAEMKPKALFADAVSASDSSILVGELAKMLKQNGKDIGPKRLFAWLRENGYLCKSGTQKNIPTQRSMEMGLFEIKESTHLDSNGNNIITKTPKVTGKGQLYFVNKLLDIAQ